MFVSAKTRLTVGVKQIVYSIFYTEKALMSRTLQYLVFQMCQCLSMTSVKNISFIGHKMHDY